MPEKISVIVPVYNEAKRLNGCMAKLKMVLQSLGINFEIIISEDGSADGTDKIAYELAHKDPAIRHLRSDVRLGREKAVQRAFEGPRAIS